MEHLGQGLLEKGTRLGEYEVERVLGVGSMGAVYEGVCTATGHRHAIKVLRPALASLPVARDRFLNEAKLTARIRHPHIVDVTDVGNDGGRVYFVMELLNGEDLARRLLRSGTLPATEIADIMLPVCDAVAEAHRRGVTHRDLKPSNIFLLVRGRRPFPVVLDFGIAKDEEGGAATSAVGPAVSGKTLFGTPYYLAPELVADHQAAGTASDQYALGVILYECLTGAPPYRGDTVDDLFRAIADGKAVPPSARRPEIPRELDAVVMRALSPDPKARFLSVAELRQALVPFSSKGTGPTPVLQPAALTSPLAVTSPPAAEASREAQKRAVSSPAIEVEAATRSPFVRTLTPEVEALDSAWFAEGDALHEAAAAVPIPSFVYVDGASDSGAAPAAEPSEPAAYEAVPKPSWNLGSRWVRVGALAGGALSLLVAVLVVTRSHAPAREQPALPAAALVQVEPTAAKPSPDNVALAPAATAPSAETAPSEPPVAAAPAATSARSAPAAPPAEAPSKEAPIAAAPPPPVPAPPPRPHRRRLLRRRRSPHCPSPRRRAASRPRGRRARGSSPPRRKRRRSPSRRARASPSKTRARARTPSCGCTTAFRSSIEMGSPMKFKRQHRGWSNLLRLAALAAFASLAATPARAASDAEQAEALIREGVKLRAQDAAARALPLFENAYQISRGPRTAAQLGLCELELGYFVEAERHLGEALASPEHPWVAKNKGTLKKPLETARANIGELTLTVSPATAEVLLNHKPIEKAQLAAPIRLARGIVDVEMRATGYQSVTETVIVTGGKREQRTYTLVRETAPPPIATAPALAVPAPEASAAVILDSGPSSGGAADAHKAKRIAAWITGGAAFGALVFGTVEALERQQPQQRLQRSHRRRRQRHVPRLRHQHAVAGVQGAEGRLRPGADVHDRRLRGGGRAGRDVVGAVRALVAGPRRDRRWRARVRVRARSRHAGRRLQPSVLIKRRDDVQAIGGGVDSSRVRGLRVRSSQRP